MNKNKIKLYLLPVFGIIVIISGIMLFGFPEKFGPTKVGNTIITDENSCFGTNISPEIDIPELPAEAKSYAIVIYTTNLPPEIKNRNTYWANWMVWNISAKKTEISANFHPSGTTGRTYLGAFNYEGPCPKTSTKLNMKLSVFAFKNASNGLNSATYFDDALRQFESDAIAQFDTEFSYQKIVD